MPDTIFGVEIPDLTPQEIQDEVFPHDPDFGWRKSRIWETTVLQLSPLLEQRIIRNTEPLFRFDLRFSVMRGPYNVPVAEFEEDLPEDILSGCDTGKFEDIWVFFNNHRGRSSPFFFFDPTFWSRFPKGDTLSLDYPNDDYRDYPRARILHPVFSSVDRYVCYFEDDDMDVSMFDTRLRSTGIRLIGYFG